jgi:hypothetical protein
MTRTGRRAVNHDWREYVETVQPTVLVLGGFLTLPPLYLRLSRRLARRGAAGVVASRVWTPDWMLAAWRGLGPIVTRSGRALLLASARSAASPLSRGAPLLIVGHSAGGMLARLLTSPVPFAGRQLNASGRIGAIVTLGTPHLVSADGDLGARISVHATEFADRAVPGACFAPRIGYLAVASKGVIGRPAGTGRERAAWRLYQGILPNPEVDAYPGDGLVPVASALLPGAQHFVLDGVVHGQLAGQPWYGSEPVIDAWWPAAVDSWRAALRVRAATSPPGPEDARPDAPA